MDADGVDDVEVVLDRLEAAVNEMCLLGLDDPADLEREADLLDEMNDLVRALRRARLQKRHFKRLRRILRRAHDREVAHARSTLDDDLRHLLEEG